MKPFVEDVVWFMDKMGIKPINFSKTKAAFLVLLVTILLISTFSYLLFKRDTHFLESLSASCSILLSMCKIFFLIFSNEKIDKLLEKLEDLWSPTKLTDEIQKNISSIYNTARKTVTVVKYFFSAATVMNICKSLFSSERTFVFECYFFSLDIGKTPNYQIIYAYQVFVQILLVFGIVAFDILFICLAYNIVSQFRLIKGGFESLPIDANTPRDDEGCLSALKVLVKHHSKVLKFVGDFDSCYRFVLLLHFLFSSIGISCVLLAISVNGRTIDIISKVKYGAILVDMIGEMFCYCFVGSLIADESESVAFTIYNTKWWVKSQPQLRRGLMLAILRSQKTAKITAGGIADLNFESFTGIMKRGYSLFAVIRTFYSNQDD